MDEPLRSRLRPATSPGGLTSPDPVTAPHGPPGHPAHPRPRPKTPDKPQNRERQNKHAHENYKITLVQPLPWKRSPEFARWIEAKAPVPANAASIPEVQLGSVACPSATTCVATGTYDDSSGRQQALVLTGSGRSWTATEVRLPGNASPNSEVQLGPLACPSTSACIAGGDYLDSSGNYHNVLLTGSGTSWTLSVAPLPANAATTGQITQVSDLACPSTTACFATGSYLDTAGQSQGLVLTGSGTTWAAARSPVPANGSTSLTAGLSALACPSVTVCIAGGAYQSNSSGTLTMRGLLLTGPGKPWVAAEAPLPANSAANPSTFVHSLACASTSGCAALGFYVDAAGQSQLMLLTGPG